MKYLCLLFTIITVSLCNSLGYAVTIPDANLAEAVREALDLGQTEPIPQKELEKLENLDAKAKGIKDLTGLEKATGLIILQLRKNQVSLIRSFIYLVDHS